MDSTRNINVVSSKYNKRDALQVLDRSFTQFGITGSTTTAAQSVEKFFQDYDDLFYSIPITGSINSHQYLVERSSELYKVVDDMSDIQPLLDEITLLRSQSVVDQQTILDLRTQLNGTN